MLAARYVIGSEGAKLPEVDQTTLALVAAVRRPLLDGFFLVATWAGSLVLLIPLSLGIIFWLSRFGYSREAWLLALSIGGASLVTHVGKLFVGRLRPTEIEPTIATMWTYSFPSAHSAQITGFIIALLIIKRRVGTDISPGMGWIWFVGIALIAIVGISRVYLQVHYTTDVLAGILVGGLWSLGLYFLGFGNRPSR